MILFKADEDNFTKNVVYVAGNGRDDTDTWLEFSNLSAGKYYLYVDIFP